MINFYNLGGQISGDAYLEEEKRLKEVCERKRNLIVKKDGAIREGKGVVDTAYLFSYIESINADIELAKLYLVGIKSAEAEVMHSVGVHYVSGTEDTKKIKEDAEKVFETYSEMCSNLEENRVQLLRDFTEYVKDVESEELRLRAYNTLVETYKNHQSLLDVAKEYREEEVKRFALSCEQYIEDLKILDELEEDNDEDDEPEA